MPRQEDAGYIYETPSGLWTCAEGHRYGEGSGDYLSKQEQETITLFLLLQHLGLYQLLLCPSQGLQFFLQWILLSLKLARVWLYKLQLNHHKKTCYNDFVSLLEYSLIIFLVHFKYMTNICQTLQIWNNQTSRAADPRCPAHESRKKCTTCDRWSHDKNAQCF